MARNPRLSASRKRDLRASTTEARYRAVVEMVERGSSVSHALKEAGLSRSAFNRLNSEYRSLVKSEGSSGRYEVSASANARFMIVDQAGNERRVRVTGKQRELAGAYRDAVEKALRQRDAKKAAKILAPFYRKKIKTLDGETITLNTDPAVLKQLRLLAEPATITDAEWYQPAGTLAMAA